MVFTLRSCASKPRACLVAGLAVLLAACGPPDAAHGFRVQLVEVTARARQLDIRLQQQLVLSSAAEDALRHGVPLTLSARFEVRAADTRGPVAQAHRVYEIRYLPLSEHYQLTAGAEVRTFPRLRHVIAALERLDTVLETTALAPGTYTLRARILLDRASLPAPMQLPAVLSGDWRHDSLWSTWPFAINA